MAYELQPRAEPSAFAQQTANDWLQSIALGLLEKYEETVKASDEAASQSARPRGRKYFEGLGSRENLWPLLQGEYAERWDRR